MFEMFECAQNISDAGITCYSLHPGVVSTNLLNDSVGWITFLGCFMCCYKSPENGAQV